MKKTIKLVSILFLVLGISGLIYLFQHYWTTGETPLHLAVEQENIPIANLLITLGADVNARDQYGGTPLDNTLFNETI